MDITYTLKTIDSEELNKVSIHLPFVGDPLESPWTISEDVYEMWAHLDRALARLLMGRHKMCVEIVWAPIKMGALEKTRAWIGCFLEFLLPNVKRTRVVNIKIEQYDPHMTWFGM